MHNTKVIWIAAALWTFVSVQAMPAPELVVTAVAPRPSNNVPSHSDHNSHSGGNNSSGPKNSNEGKASKKPPSSTRSNKGGGKSKDASKSNPKTTPTPTPKPKSGNHTGIKTDHENHDSSKNGTAHATSHHSKSSDGPDCKYAVSGTDGPAKAVKTTSACGNHPLPTGGDWVKIPSPNGTDSAKWLTAKPGPGPCSNAVTLSTKCYDDLDLYHYISWWWDTNKDWCKNRNQGFADCFYAKSTNLAPSNCGDINTNTNCRVPSYAPFEDKWMGTTNFYVAWNIYNINNFFANYYTSLNDANGFAVDALGSIIETVDPVKDTNVLLNDLLTAFSVGFALIPGGEGAIGALLVAALQQIPGTVKFLYPEGTLDSQQMDWDDVSKSLGKVIAALQKQGVESLQALQNDHNAFAIFTKSGAFSTDKTPSLPDMTHYMTKSMLTYIVSQAYQHANVFIGKATHTSVHDLSGKDLAWDIDCDKYNDDGVCGPWWYDKDSDTTYGLATHPDGLIDFSDQMAKLIGGPTSGDWLFAGADECSQENHDQSGSKKPGKPTFKNGKVVIPCLSSMKVCTWEQNVNVNHDVRYQLFSDCKSNVIPNEFSDLTECITEIEPMNVAAVPETYLGGLLHANAYKNGFCVHVYD